MSWKIDYSRKAGKFAEHRGLCERVEEEVAKFLKAYERGSKLPDVIVLKGIWKGYFRIKFRGLRIIFDVNPAEKTVFIEAIDYRGDVYKKG